VAAAGRCDRLRRRGCGVGCPPVDDEAAGGARLATPLALPPDNHRVGEPISELKDQRARGDDWPSPLDGCIGVAEPAGDGSPLDCDGSPLGLLPAG